ncbi:condensin subunit Smc [Anaerovirgula multivorans]|uniref:Chromosome partition protein Smc n=1 Tax=Anaerovirgula multivorans TaxID=312168 RepID=A0A239A5D5_9FIRM|nr:chromosome segregation protein SMC [Anaerovirgula multivorans]SNR90254.1 condensin subunit Smc [Anaerovirgula multivorans]
MYLKKLELYGFKSFANKIELNFEKGVTAVVGPNGSGKSNISDGIKWVLGEQSVKSLRGSKMEDVIFAGTSTRKPLGMSEVSLTLDNSSQALPIEYDEITITRRMYRSGESEYYLNKSACRLKDIRELLMDTGIGKDGYSIIGQGKIDEILSSKSEDRRQLFEEAAGIVKYKHRKNEAEKKLSATKDNLIRVSDILNELENQLEPLKKQSFKAQKYNELKETLLKLEVNLFIKEIDKIDTELKHIHQQMEILKKSLSTQEIEKNNFCEKLSEIENQLELREEEVAKIQDEYHNTQKEIGKKEGEINVNQEKLMHYTQNINRLEKEIKDISNINLKTRGELEAKLIQLKTIDTDLDELETEMKDKVLQYNDINRSKSLKEEDVENSKSTIIDTLNAISDLKSEGNRYKTLTDTMQQRMEQIHKEINHHEEKAVAGHKTFIELQQGLTELRSNMNNIMDRIKNITSEKHLLVNQENNILKKLDSMRKEIQHKASKKNVIEEMEKEHDGYNKSVKNILVACDRNQALGEGVYGVVANLLKVPRGYEVAIETALGASIQHIVTRNEEDAKRLIGFLKKNSLGRVTLLPLTSIQKKTIQNSELKIIEGFKDVKVAIDIIEFDHSFTNVFSSLLSRVLIVPNLDIGVKMAKATQHRFKIVTIDGDVMNLGGSITGGSSGFKGSSILGRKRELEELTESIGNLEKEKHTVELQYNQLIEAKNTLDEEVKMLTEKQQDLKIQEATLASKEQQTEEENRKTDVFIKQLKREIKELMEAKQTTSEKYIGINKEIASMEEMIASTKHTLEDCEKHLLIGKQKLEELNEEITKHKVNLASLQEQKRGLLQEIENLQETIKHNEMQCSEKNEEIINTNNQYSSLQEELMKSKKELQNSVHKLNQLEERLTVLKNGKQELQQVQKQTKEMLNQVEEIIKDLHDSTYKLDVKCTRLEMQQQAFYNKLWEEYELTYNHAKEIKEDVPDHINMTKEIKSLKDGIKSLGSINLDAIEEYESVKERHQFLKQQKDDLESARQTLVKVIKDMEESMKQQFLQEFNKIRENFNEVFIKLFGGGKAELVLEDEKDLLDCGIEIIAQPPGKKLQSLSLLSGGERALTAISLLFGILLVKPSPFCILDEIEAALDDANVNRFAKFLQELSFDTQFIVVTHRKGTMESADALYGVTMEEEGISKIVSVKFTDEFNKEIAS